MIAIADAGPLLHLYWVDASSWALPPRSIDVVDEVWDEVEKHAPEALNDTRLQRVSLSSTLSPLLTDWQLDLGEQTALSYALTRSETVLVLCNERQARFACAALDLPTPFTPRAAVDYCAEYLVGKDPLHIERHWQHMFRRQLFRGGSDMMAAIGAIDIALWDIKGKSLDKPVYELLGGPTREKVRLYTHLAGNSPEALAAQASARVEEGFTALRVYPFGDFGSSDFEEGRGLESMSYSGMQNNAVERIAAVREAAGPDVDIMIDVVNRLTPAEAIGVGRALEPFQLYFFEDPIEPENMDQWGWVAQQQPIPLAMGERLYTVYQFRNADGSLRDY